jgi:ribosome assembly protein YihI (activator of Der GTPase)
MNIQKSILFSGIAILVAGLFYILFASNLTDTTPTSVEEDHKTSSHYNSGTDAIHEEEKDSSLFDGNNGFLDFSSVGIEEVSNSEPAPISPAEKAKRRALVIESYKPLAKLFPKNRYIPRKLTKEEEEKKIRTEENMAYLQDRLLAGESLSPTEKAYYYSQKVEESNEKLEILNYATKELLDKGNLPENSKKMIEERINSINQRLGIYKEETESAEKLGGKAEDFD